MNHSELTNRHCIPCERGGESLKPQQVEHFLLQVPTWELQEDDQPRITRTWKFKDFAASMSFVNAIAKIAEEENHHPDISISYSRITCTLWTHSVGGLTENDFIMAAKIDRAAGE